MMTADQRPDTKDDTTVADPDEPTITPMVRYDSFIDPGMVTALGVGSHPSLPDDVEPNRSGIPGTGEPAGDGEGLLDRLKDGVGDLLGGDRDERR